MSLSTKQVETDSGNKSLSGMERYLVFTIGESLYAILLSSVKEVTALRETTPILGTPSYFLGLMNLRGLVISVVDLGLKFNSKPAGGAPESAVIILDLPGSAVGVVALSVDRVLTFPSDQIQPAPNEEIHKQNNSVTGVIRDGERLILLLDIVNSIRDISEIQRAFIKECIAGPHFISSFSYYLVWANNLVWWQSRWICLDKGDSPGLLCALTLLGARLVR